MIAPFVVVGAGMAGILAAAMLRHECSLVVERQTQVPNNHSAVLRFRSSIVGDVLNIPFKKVKVAKIIHSWKNPIADALAYSLKTNGTMTIRSISTADNSPMSTAMQDRFIAPADLISRMRAGTSAKFQFGADFFEKQRSDHKRKNQKVISTIPMYHLMDALGWQKKEDFRTKSGFNANFEIDGLDAYFSIYVPDPNLIVSRISATGRFITMECSGSAFTGEVEAETKLISHLSDIMRDITGISLSSVIDCKLSNQRYAKILPYDETDRQRFIMWASEKHGIYSLGRYATWRPGLLLDDVVNDVRVIHRLALSQNNNYNHKKGQRS